MKKTNKERVEMALDMMDDRPGTESSVLFELSGALDSGELKDFLVMIEKKISEAHSELVRDFRDYSKIVKILESLKKIVEKHPKNPKISRELFEELMLAYEDRLKLDEAISAWKRLEKVEKSHKLAFFTPIICDFWSILIRFKYNRFY